MDASRARLSGFRNCESRKRTEMIVSNQKRDERGREGKRVVSDSPPKGELLPWTIYALDAIYTFYDRVQYISRWNADKRTGEEREGCSRQGSKKFPNDLAAHYRTLISAIFDPLSIVDSCGNVYGPGRVPILAAPRFTRQLSSREQQGQGDVYLT